MYLILEMYQLEYAFKSSPEKNERFIDAIHFGKKHKQKQLEMRLVGRGTHGSIFVSGASVYKRIPYKDDTGISTVCLRELDAFKKLKHPNVMDFLSIRCSSDYVYIEMEYIPHTLNSLIYDSTLEMLHIRSVCMQLTRGTSHIVVYVLCTPLFSVVFMFNL